MTVDFFNFFTQQGIISIFIVAIVSSLYYVIIYIDIYFLISKVSLKKNFTAQIQGRKNVIVFLSSDPEFDLMVSIQSRLYSLADCCVYKGNKCLSARTKKKGKHTNIFSSLASHEKLFASLQIHSAVKDSGECVLFQANILLRLIR